MNKPIDTSNPDRIDEPMPARPAGPPADHLAMAMSTLDDVLARAAFAGRDLPASALVSVVKALARRVEEVAAAVRRRDQQEADDGR